MATLALRQHLPRSSHLVAGCMGLGGSWDTAPLTVDATAQAQGFIETALGLGITTFDHADIYTLGKAEQAFGMALKKAPELRDQMVLQTKCGIRFEDASGPKRYDFSASWVTASVENSLKRLNTDMIDVLLLHRPDPLMEREELAGALHGLVAAGKIRHIGVSNMHSQQIAFLAQALELPIAVNQIQVSLGHLDWLDEGVTAGDRQGVGVNFASGTLEYCQQNGIQIQSWGALAGGMFSGNSASSSAADATVLATSNTVAELAKHHATSREAIVLAWLMRHPAGIQPVIGTTKPERMSACVKALEVTLSREEWYRLYVLARGQELP